MLTALTSRSAERDQSHESIRQVRGQMKKKKCSYVTVLVCGPQNADYHPAHPADPSRPPTPESQISATTAPALLGQWQCGIVAERDPLPGSRCCRCQLAHLTEFSSKAIIRRTRVLRLQEFSLLEVACKAQSLSSLQFSLLSILGRESF